MSNININKVIEKYKNLVADLQLQNIVLHIQLEDALENPVQKSDESES